MSTTSTIEPGLGDNWSSFGAIIFVSVLGPALLLLFTAGPFVVLGMAAVFIDVVLCTYVGFCTGLGSGDWGAWLLEEHYLLYVCWVTLATGYACVATLESAFHIFRRAAPLTVLVWHAALIFVLGAWIPIDSLRWYFSVGWIGTVLVSMHLYLSYSALRLFRPPEPAAIDSQRAPNVPREICESIEFPGGLGPRQRRQQRILALCTAVHFGVAYYGLLRDMPILLIGFLGLGVYNGLFLLHQIMSSRNDRALKIGPAGLNHLGQDLSWGEIGRVWAGTGRHRHLAVIETSEVAAKRVLQASTWVYRLFAKAEVAHATAGTAAHSVLIDMRFLLGEAAELVQAVEARRPPGSRWIPAAEVS